MAVIAILIIGYAVYASGNGSTETLFVLAVAPSSYLLWHFHHADKYKHESTKLLLGTFLLGGASSFVAGMIELAYPQPDAGDLLLTFLYFLFGVGLVEESMKFLAVRIYSYRSVHFDETMDGIVFGVTAALGFATVENVAYVLQFGISTAIVRAFISVPGHAFWGAIMGYYLAKGKIEHKPLLALEGLGFAAFLHGLFDTLATEIVNPVVSLLALAGLVWVVYFEVVKKDVAKAQEESIYRPR